MLRTNDDHAIGAKKKGPTVADHRAAAPVDLAAAADVF
jgi:hypothetical protein